jgi:glycerol-3-phosphate dehydrogenase
MARTVEDVLARRTRALFLNAQAAHEMALPVARIMAEELHYDEDWISQQVSEFQTLASQYSLR